MSELKPCPFCGGEGRVIGWQPSGKQPKRWTVHCDGCQMELRVYRTDADVIEAWNTRHEPDVFLAYERDLADLRKKLAK